MASIKELKQERMLDRKALANPPLSEGQRLMSEVAHIMKFMKNMGYDIKGLSVENICSIRHRLKEELVVCGHIQKPEKVKDAFK